MECRFCGRPTEIVLDDMPICEDCYEERGSCCLEFGGDDLWQEREQAGRSQPEDGDRQAALPPPSGSAFGADH
jgi:hypothetical protein